MDIDTQEDYRLRIAVHLLEDLHTGSGSADAAVDALIGRDRRGLPVIRATHYRGVLRAAAQDLCALGLLDAARYDALFAGRTARRQRVFRMTSLYWVAGGTVGVHGASARRGADARAPEQAGNRAPAEETLRSEERLPAGAVLAGELAVRGAARRDDLILCIRHANILGSGRNRGTGVVRVELHPRPGAAPDPAMCRPPAGSARLRLLLRNLDPLCIPRTGVPENLIPSDCFIRGQALEGALRDACLRMAGDGAVVAPGTLSVGNAYPVPERVSAVSGIELAVWELTPVPLDLKTPKPVPDGDPDWPWWARTAGESAETGIGTGARQSRLDEDEDEDADDGGYKRPAEREFLFRTGSGTPWMRYAPTMGVHLRVAVAEEQLFSEEEIAEDTLFLADLWFCDGAAAERFAEVMAPVLSGTSWLAIGRGGRPVEVAGLAWLPPGPAWPAAPDPATAPDPSGDVETELSLHLDSDLIASGDTLGYQVELGPELLMELAGIPLDSLPVDEWRTRAHCESIEVHGFNEAAGLPMAPAVAIRRGSVIRLRGRGVHGLRDRLAALPALGERTWRGFGRFRLDFDPQASGERERLVARARELAGRWAQGASRTQWQGLREAVFAAPDKAAVDRVLRLLLAHSETRGGSGWKREHIEALRAALRPLTAEEGRFLVDLTVRWLPRGERP